MPSHTPRSSVRIAGVPLHAIFAPITAVCLVETLATDVVCWKATAMMWAGMSVWLLTAGLVVGLFAVLTGLIGFFGDAQV